MQGIVRVCGTANFKFYLVVGFCHMLCIVCEVDVKSLVVFVIIVLLSVACSDKHEVVTDGAGIESFGRFIAGAMLLNNASNSCRQIDVSRKYMELKSICGLTTDSVVSFLSNMKEDPQIADKFYQIVSGTLQTRADTAAP